MQSRVEDILMAIINGTSSSELPPPQSRNEALLLRVLDKINEGGGGSLPVHICTSDEYDHTTGVPTISSPDEGTLYLVPASSATTGNLFDEWVYVDSAWEKVGSVNIDIDELKEEIKNEVLDEIDDKVDDKAPAILDTASGAIASFPDGAAVAAKDITIGIEPVQAGSGDPSPTNVRPISGWTGAKVTRTGKNKFDESIAITSYFYNVDGTFTNKITDTRSPAMINAQAFNGSTLVAYADASGAYPNRTIGTITINSSVTKFVIKHNGSSRDLTIEIPWTAQGTFTFSCLVPSNDPTTVGGLVIKDIQVEEGSTATPFAPYTGMTYPISWQSEAGTVYGGTLDVTTGLLTVTHGNIANYNGESLPGKWISSMDVYSAGGTPTTGAQVVYELATPYAYQLTPTEVTLLLGDNNVWADTGDSTVTYRADTKLYIQKINAPTDDDMVADAQIASGRYFIVGGNLYKSTTTIPAGDTITPGTNCILTNLADALNALNT